MQNLPEVGDLYSIYFPSSIQNYLTSTLSLLKDISPLLFKALQQNPSLVFNKSGDNKNFTSCIEDYIEKSFDSFTLPPLLFGIFVLSVKQSILNDSDDNFKPILTQAYFNSLNGYNEIYDVKVPHISYDFQSKINILSHTSRHEDCLLILCYLDKLAYMYSITKYEDVRKPYISIYPSPITFLLFFTLIKHYKALIKQSTKHDIIIYMNLTLVIDLLSHNLQFIIENQLSEKDCGLGINKEKNSFVFQFLNEINEIIYMNIEHDPNPESKLRVDGLRKYAAIASSYLDFFCNYDTTYLSSQRTFLLKDTPKEQSEYKHTHIAENYRILYSILTRNIGYYFKLLNQSSPRKSMMKPEDVY